MNKSQTLLMLHEFRVAVDVVLSDCPLHKTVGSLKDIKVCFQLLGTTM